MPRSFRPFLSVLPAACAALLSAGPAAAAAPACVAHSGPGRTALVELYTSEGCSSCPPADAQLSQIAAHGSAVPLALHVTYWDGLGWRDPYAQTGFEARQRQLARSNGQSTVYTPHYFVNGREALDWRSQLTPALRQVDASAAPVQLSLRAGGAPGASRLDVEITARAAVPQAQAPTWQVMLAVAESGLQSSVRAGENRGATLRHDQVVRRLIGPLAWPAGDEPLRQTVPLDPGWQRERLSLAAFVQDARTGEVLQAVALPPCVR